MPYDSAISIGGQSLINGIWRVLQPAVGHLQGWLPISVPGLTNAAMRVTRFVPAARSSLGGVFQVMAFVEARADVLITASVQAGTLRLSLGDVRMTVPAMSGTLDVPEVRGAATLPRNASAGSIALPTGPVDIALNELSGTVNTPAHRETLSLPETVATLRLPVDAGNLALPLPAVVPVAVNLTPLRSTPINVFIAFDVRDPVDASTGFGVTINSGDPPLVGAVAPEVLPADQLARTLRRNLEAVVRQLLQGVTVLQPEIDVDTIAEGLAAAARNAIGEVLRGGFSALVGRTGKVIFPPAGTGASCEVALLPTHANAQLVFDTSVPGHYLQVAFARSAPVGDPVFPWFTPSGPLDVQVDISNEFLRDLLCCLVEKLPGFAFSGGGAPVSDGRGVCCDWTGVVLQLGIIALDGTLSLCIARTSDGTKEILLTGSFSQGTNLLDIKANFTLVLSVDLNDAAAITGLKIAQVRSLDVGAALSAGAWVFFIAAAVFTLLVPGWSILIFGLPPLVVGLISAQLRGLLRLLFSHTQTATSPPAIPPAIFDAFGRLSPASIRIDDLVARGTLTVPSAPWSLLPMIAPAEMFPNYTHGNTGGEQPPP